MTLAHNTQQQALIDAPITSRVVGVAGAGTGKTTTILARTERILNEYTTGDVVLITFTRAAANDLRERIARHIEDRRRVSIGTFHSIIGNMIREQAIAVGLSPSFSIIDENSSNIMYRNIVEENETYLAILEAWAKGPNEKKLLKRHFTLLANSVSTLVNMAYPEELVSGVFSDETLYRLRKSNNAFTEENTKKVANMLYNVFRDSIVDGRRTNTVTYDHILFIGYLMVKNGMLASYQSSIAHIIVDEYQDTNMLQDEFIRALGGDRLTIVGDIDQAIYEFRGGKPSLISEHAKEAAVYNLSHNYRSYQPILDLANNVIRNNKIGAEIRKPLEADRPFDTNYGGLSLIACDSDRLESDRIVEHIKLLHRGGCKYSDMSILLRSRMTLAAISQALTQAKIPVNDTTKYADFMRSDVMLDTLNFIKVYTNPKDIYAFLGIINRPKQGIGPETINKLQKIAAEHSLGLVEFLLSPHTETLTPALKAKMQRFIQTYQRIIDTDSTSDMSLIDLVDSVLASFGYIQWITSGTQGAKNKRDLTTMSGMVRDFEEEYRSDHPEASLYDVASAFVFDMSSSAKEETVDGVCITTIHNAKGLEWNHVFLIGLEEENFPGTRIADEADMESERRLLYVALTRAKQSLHIFACKHRITRDAPLNPSRFLGELGMSFTHALKK